jgi:cyclophilin family peptidyl-prolyl cis-trans isomerase
MLKQKLSALLFGLVASTLAWAAPSVEIQTSQGTIVIELDAKSAPKTVENFLQYARDGFYKDTIFHRVIPNFMIQGGGFTANMQQKPTRPPIQNEAEQGFKNGLKNLRGTIAMARTGHPHSATAQFFINHRNNSSLDYPGQDGWGYTVFGRVTQGMDVVDKIAAIPTGVAAGMPDVPRQPVVIQSVKILSEK